MPLLGFTPTKKMLEEVKKFEVVHTGVVVDVIHDGPVMETVMVPSVEVPTYDQPILLHDQPILLHDQPILLHDEPKLVPVVKPLLESSKSTKLPPVSLKKTPDPKRKVSLNPLSN